MDHIAQAERNYEVDLESGCTVSEESSSSEETSPGVRKQAKNLLAKVCSRFVDGSIKGEERVGLCGGNVLNVNGVSMENVKVEERKDDEGKKAVKEKRKKSSNKKAPKPPKPPRGPSLDAADQKLIREIAELAMLKRARVERMRALRKMKAAKQSSSNSNLFAMVFTMIFCLVIFFQGMSSSRTPVSFQGSPMSTDTTEGALISVQFSGNPSSDPNGLGYVSPNLVEQVAGSDLREKLNRAAG
ncbi:hypothetical protein LWI29_004443 [Acer saccharum]|uniref:Transmembrane protein n=1 Tax=Acer saccharum TaxID=4024 RepID=A0AA39W8U5_ACESA|nr:hypothetical protein LWI29_004443 [Acer saccharum]KAK1592133.1 hypothetical protein Q3G72_020032 [Acer saccharum]